MTLPEVLLWQQLRRRPGGLKFRRQHAIEPYVVDFYCREAALAIEVDGTAHDGEQRHALDAARDDRLRARGLTVLRIPARDVMDDAAAVVEWILVRVRDPLHQPSAGPPPRSGEE